MKSSFNRQGIRRLQRIGSGFGTLIALVNIIESALIAVSNKRTGSLALNAREFARIVGQGQRPVECDVARKLSPRRGRRSPGFLEHELLTLKTERLGTFDGATVAAIASSYAKIRSASTAAIFA